MSGRLHGNEDEWRHTVFVAIVSVRHAVSELAFVIALIALALPLSKWWDDAAIVLPGAAFSVALISYMRNTAAEKRLQKLFEKIDRQEDD